MNKNLYDEMRRIQELLSSPDSDDHDRAAVRLETLYNNHSDDEIDDIIEVLSKEADDELSRAEADIADRKRGAAGTGQTGGSKARRSRKAHRSKARRSKAHRSKARRSKARRSRQRRNRSRRRR